MFQKQRQYQTNNKNILSGYTLTYGVFLRDFARKALDFL
jgi:hypothetical protein